MSKGRPYFLQTCNPKNQPRFYVGTGGGAIAPKPEPCPNLWLQQQYAVVKPANSYTGVVFWRVGVVDLVVLACFEGDD